MGMVVVLFFKQEGAFFSAFKNRSLLVPATGILVLMTIAPIFFYAGLWDRYLSFSLYAGQQKRYLVQIPALALDHIPKEWNDYLLDPKAKDGHMLLSPSSWSSKELNVPLISEWRIIRRFSETLCSYDLGGSQVRFYVDHRHLSNKEKRIFTCDQIDEMGY